MFGFWFEEKLESKFSFGIYDFLIFDFIFLVLRWIIILSCKLK